MARRRSDGGVEECKGYSPPNYHTTSASSTPMPLGSWDLNAGTWSTETESFRSARMARSRQGTHQIRRRRRAARSLTSQGRAEPLCASTWSGERARFVGLFQGCTGLWTAGCWLARRLNQHHHGPRYFNFPYFCTMCSLEKLGIVDQNGWNLLVRFVAENALPSATTRPRVAVPGETNLSTQVTTDTAVA